nr:class I SAM-dependent methyltransferase [uncultured Holophaga sp.]
MQQEPDWAELWRELVELRSRDRGEPSPNIAINSTDKAFSFDEHVKKRWEKEDSSRSFLLDMLRARPGSSILDIGAGTGSWVCLLAPLAARVTAVEPSPAMAHVMRENIRTLGLTNTEVVEAPWPEAQVGMHDISLCSHAMYGCADFVGFVRRMEEVTRHCCVLLMRAPAPDGVMAEISRKVLGQSHDSANFQVAYNALLQMGIFANVLMEDTGPWRSWSHGSLEEALLDVKKKLGLLHTGGHDASIREILERRLIMQEGRYTWPSGVQTALLHWHR